MIDVNHLNKMLNDLHKVIYQSAENTKYKILLFFLSNPFDSFERLSI